MTDTSLLTYPVPPSHYVEFKTSPTVMQPPDISSLGPTYRMFGQVVENPNFPSKAPNAPPIDRDVLVYEPKLGLKAEIIRLVESLPQSVVNLLRGIENNPTQNSNKVLRDFDCRLKSLFHALESLRPYEARESILKFTEAEINLRKAYNDEIEEIIERLNL
jgi:mediator of RNA polymerase II transcription subunit 7